MLSLTRYVALVRARRNLSSIDLSALTSASTAIDVPTKRKRKPKKWSPLDNIFVPRLTAADGNQTLDGTLDFTAYQLFRDNLLPPMQKRPEENDNGAKKCEDTAQDETGEKQRQLRELEETVAKDLKHGIQVRRSIAETAIVIGCDEAGRGPLAGPVVGAAVCRIPLSNYSNKIDGASARPEQFGVCDSKQMKELQRQGSFQRLTGADNFFTLLSSGKARARTLCVGDKEEDIASATDVGDASAAVDEALTASSERLVCLRGFHHDTYFRYVWSISIGNHKFVDTKNVFAASMSCMDSAAKSVWLELEQPITAGSNGTVLPAPSQLLNIRLAALAPYDDEAEQLTELSFPLTDCSAANVFGSTPRQPPLVLVDGSHAPQSSVSFFGDVEISGAVHSLVKGDTKSWSIAAASNLAKAGRDEMMDTLHEAYPLYGFNRHRGYPVVEHIKAIKKHGLTPVHRLSYKPCAEVAGVKSAKPKRVRETKDAALANVKKTVIKKSRAKRN